MKRVFLIVLDSAGIGELPDAAEFGDAGSNTLRTIASSPYFKTENMAKLGYFNIDGVEVGTPVDNPVGSFARMAEMSKGKDTTIGHWEIAGMISPKPLPTFPEGFPEEFMERYSRAVGRKLLCNKPYSGTEVIKDYGQEHLETGALIIYTSADSVFQIAAHEELVPVEELYRYCEIAREMLTGDLGVGRVIARPFLGTPGEFYRTTRRHDYSLQPPKTTMLDVMAEKGLATIGVGKIYDIFAGKSVNEFVRTSGNPEGIERTIEYLDKDFEGICFVNLVDTDMLYGHRNDIDGYAKAMTYFDEKLPEIMDKLRDEDILMITADHGCDPGTPSTDHSREYTPLMIYGKNIKAGINFGTRKSFADIAATILRYFDIEADVDGEVLEGLF